MNKTLVNLNLLPLRTRLHGAVLILMWSLIVVSTIMVCIVVSVDVQSRFTLLQSHEVDIPSIFYAGFIVFWEMLRFIGFLFIGLYLFLKKSKELFPLVTALLLITVSPVFSDSPYQTSALLQWMETIVFYIGWALVIPFFYIYPTGKFLSNWSIGLTVIWVTVSTGMIFFPDSFLDPLTWPVWLDKPAIFFFHASAIYSQIYRYRKVSNTIERLQTKWFVYGVVLTLITIPIIGLLDHSANAHAFSIMIGSILRSVCPLIIPLSIFIAILRHGLWNIDTVINRSIVYGTLSMIVIATYVFGVYGTSIFLKTESYMISSLIMTGIIAVGFQPLREILQRRVNRFMFGDREQPYEVLSRLGQRLEGTFKEDDVLQTIAKTVKEALKLPYVAITLSQGKQKLHVVSEGEPVKDLWNIPLVYQGEQMGELQVAPRFPGEAFTHKDQLLLNDLARHAGITAYNVRLLIELQRSRAEIITTREEERRRLRRDLHDGLGPTLAALHLQTMLLKKLIFKDLESALNLTDDIQKEVFNTIEDVRLIVYDLRPPTLEELGLVGSIRAYAEQISNYKEDSPLQISVHSLIERPKLPAAIEIALYRIIKEALTNVIHHSKANHCKVTFEFTHEVIVEVSDDGIGISFEKPMGEGLRSMTERSKELGGTCEVTVNLHEQRGTTVKTRIPLKGLVNDEKTTSVVN